MSIKIRSLIYLQIILVIFLPSAAFASAETLSNTGFIPSNIWFSKDPFYAGDRVRIYSLVFNGSDKDLRGKVNFYDNSSLLCSSDFSSLAGQMSEVWCDWQATAGKAKISVKIADSKASAPGESEQSVNLANSNLSVSDRLIGQAPVSAVSSANNSTPLAPAASILTAAFNKVAELISGVTASPADKTEEAIQAAESELQSSSTSLGRPAVHSPARQINNYSPFDRGPSLGANSSSAIDKFLKNNLASLYPILETIKNWFESFTNFIAGFILPKLQSLTGGSGPVAAVLGFIYNVIKYILNTPALFASILIAAIWKLISLIFKRDRF